MKAGGSGAERRSAILVVEDEPILRMAVCDALKDLGCQVLEAADGQQALTVLRERSVALVFADIALPGGITGIELGHRIRAEFPATKILLTSAHAKVGETGFPFVPKPYYFSQVHRQIDALLAGPE